MYGYVYHDTSGQESWSNIEDPVVPVDRNLCGHPLAGLLWETQFEKVLLGLGWKKVPNWECLFVHRSKSCQCAWMTKMTGRKQNHNLVWNDETRWSGETTSYIDHVYVGCPANRTNVLLKKTRCSDHESLPEQLKNCQLGKNLTQTLSRGPMTWKDMRKNAMKDISSCTKSLNSLLGRPSFQEGGTGISWRIVKTILRKFEMLVLARVGRPEILWSVKKLPRRVANWTRDCAIARIHHTNDFREHCLGTTAQHCRLKFDSDFAGDFSEVELVPINWMTKKKRTSISHSVTESEIISWGAGLRKDGIPVDLWDVVTEVLHSSKNTHTSSTGRPNPKTKFKKKKSPRCWWIRKFFSMWSSVKHFWRQWMRSWSKSS